MAMEERAAGPGEGDRSAGEGPYPLRVASFLAPILLPFYRAVGEYLERRLRRPVTTVTGRDFGQFAAGQADVGFVCGLPYTLLAGQAPPPVELLVAPVLVGDRYEGRPVYFSDVVVAASSAVRRFAELRGRSWAFNDRGSHSGYNVVRHHLLAAHETGGYFGRVVEAGSHERCIALVRDGEVDAAAIDSQVLAVTMRERPELRQALRVIDAFGPSPSPPVVAASRLDRGVRDGLRAALLAMHEDDDGREALQLGLVERFAGVADDDYEVIRHMAELAERAGFTYVR
jgi:phosphonate transport system substrate-binding protein